MIKETSSLSLFDIYLKFDTKGELSSRLYDNGDYFMFAIIHCPHIKD